MLIKCVVACSNASGVPDFFATEIECTEEQYNNGDHYEMATRYTRQEDYEGPMVVFDENDGPKWLFEQMFGPE